MRLNILASVTAPEVPTGIDFFDFSSAANVVLMIGLFVPVLTAVITKKMATSQLKAVSTIVLTALTATASTLVGADGEWAWRTFGNSFLSAFFLAILSYYGYWKHSGLTRAVTEKTADFGVLVKKRDAETESRPAGPGPEASVATQVEAAEKLDKDPIVIERPDATQTVIHNHFSSLEGYRPAEEVNVVDNESEDIAPESHTLGAEFRAEPGKLWVDPASQKAYRAGPDGSWTQV